MNSYPMMNPNQMMNSNQMTNQNPMMSQNQMSQNQMRNPYPDPMMQRMPSSQSAWAGEVQRENQPPEPNGGEWIDLRHELPEEVIGAPMSREETYQGSMKSMLGKNVGSYIVARFLIGTRETISCEGLLTEVGNDYLVIFQENWNRYIVGDYYSLKFAEFYHMDGDTPVISGGEEVVDWKDSLR